MADLSIIYRIAADITGLEDGVAGAAKSIGRLGTDAKKLGTALLPISAAVTGIGVVALKSAIDFESSFAGVRKTVAGAVDSFGNLTATGAQLQQQMRNLAKEIPVNVNELNKLGESAGALGIPTQSVVEFTRTMAMLGVTTNLTSDQAADAVARIQNIFGAAGQDTEKLASTLVALGNAGASTEKEIVEMGQRIAGAGHSVGLTQAQVLGFASTLASVGINAEAGGSTISRVFLRMQADVEKGKGGLEDWARVAGVSAAEFKTVFERDAAQATQMVVEGLGRMKASGENVGGTIEGLVGKSILMKDTLLRLSGAGGLLADQLKIGNTAWQENTALTKEAEQRFKTMESQMTLLWNQFKDVAITLGTALMPVMKSLLTIVQNLIPYIETVVNWFTKLSPEMQTAIVIVGGLVAALGPALVAFGAVAASISAALPVIAAIGTAIATLASGPLGLIAVAVMGVVTVWRNWDTITGIVTNVYTAVKTWLVDKFQAIVDAIKAKIAAVTGAFKGMYDAVVGHSFVPDMIAGIAAEFGKLNGAMVTPAAAAASAVQGVFQTLVGNLGGILGRFGEAAGRWVEGLVSNLSARWQAGISGAMAGVGTLQAGGSTGAAIGNVANAAIGAGMATSAASMAAGTGAALGASIATGAATMGIGLAAVGVYRGIQALMGQREHMRVNDVRDAWFNANGGLEGVNQAAEGAGDTNLNTTRAIFGARTQRDFQAAVARWEQVTGRGTGVPGLANGGLVRQPTFAMIGEAGPELVTPLSQLGSLFDGRPISVNVYLDGRKLAQNQVRHIPRIVEQYVGA